MGKERHCGYCEDIKAIANVTFVLKVLVLLLKQEKMKCNEKAEQSNKVLVLLDEKQLKKYKMKRARKGPRILKWMAEIKGVITPQNTRLN